MLPNLLTQRELGKASLAQVRSAPITKLVKGMTPQSRVHPSPSIVSLVNRGGGTLSNISLSQRGGVSTLSQTAIERHRGRGGKRGGGRGGLSEMNERGGGNGISGKGVKEPAVCSHFI